MKKLNKILEDLVEPGTDMVLYTPAKSSEVYSPGHKYDPDQKEEETKYIVALDPVKDGGDGSLSISHYKVEDGVVENLQYEHGKFNVEKILEGFRLAFKEKEPPGRLPDTIEKTDDVKFKIEFKDRKVFTKEELAEQYKSQVDTGGSFWDFFKHIGNSNICHFELVHPWHKRYQNAYVWQSYRDLGDGWYILLTINKESGIVAVFKIFDKDFDINSDAGTKGEILHLYNGNPKDMHEVEKVIKINLGKTMHFYDVDEEFGKGIGIDFRWHPKGYGEQWGTVIKPKQDIDIIPVENPAPSLYDFIEHGRKMEMDVVNVMRVTAADFIGHISSPPTHPIADILFNHPYVIAKMLRNSLKGRRLAKRRKFKLYSFYFHNKMI